MKAFYRRGLVFGLVFGVIAASAATPTTAATYYWDTNQGTAGAGGTPNGTWGTSNSYWSTSSSGTATSLQSSTSAADNLYFVAGPGTNSGENAFTVTVAGSQNADSLVFQSSGTATLSGAGTISLWGSGGITLSQFGYGFTPQGPVTISPDIILQASQTWTNKSSSRLTIGGSVVNGGNSLTVGGPGKTLVSGAISGSGGLAKVGAGTLTMTGSSTYSGGTTITAGVLQLGDGTSGHDGTLTGGITNNAALVYDLNASQTFAGCISGSGSLITIGTGALTLTGSSPFSGGTTISAGTLQLGNGTVGHDGLLSGSGGIVNNAVLVSNLAGSQTLASVISGSGSLVKAGAGVLALTQPNSFSGCTTISAGTLQLGNGNSGNDGSLVGVGGVNDNATLAFNLFGTQSYAGNISGSGALLKLGTGSLTLAGTNNTYSGGTTVSGGVLAVTSTSALPGYNAPSKVAVGSGGTLVLNMGGSGSWSATNLGTLLSSNGTGFASGSMLGIDTTGAIGGFSCATAISGSMGLTKFGPNALTLTSSNGYNGSTVISGGTLQLGDGTNSSHDGSVLANGGIVNNAMLVYDLVGPQTYSGAISGVGNLTKAGSNILTLAGTNTYSGMTIISGGTVNLSNSNALLGSTLVAPPSGSLVFDRGVSSNAFSLGGLSGTGSITLQNNASPPAAIALAVGGNNASTIYSGVLVARARSRKLAPEA